MFYEDNSLKYSELFSQKMNLQQEKPVPVIAKILICFY